MSEVKTLTISGSSSVNNGQYVRIEYYAALKAERDALAAENLALKGLVEERCWVYDYDVEGYRDAHDYLPATLSTDAWLKSRDEK